MLLLCASCRVGICVRVRGSTGGCLMWDKKMKDPDLVFHCLFCIRTHGFDFEVRCMTWATWNPGLTMVPQFKLRIAHYPKKIDIIFRYDPPVLIIGATLHEEEDSFCRLLRQHLSIRYQKNRESVCAPIGFQLAFLRPRSR